MRTLLMLSFLISLCKLSAQTTELGNVAWLREYDEALKIADQENKAVLILFQEVPGCSTCRNYGSNVLSDPLIVDAIEHYFVPLAIYNNKGGKDAQTLKHYKEPSWNNPVVRIVDKKGKPILDRLSGNYRQDGLVNYMLQSFPKRNEVVPDYFIYLEEAYSMSSGNYKVSDFSMYCFWSGEGHLGQHEGVITTEPGFKNGREVVRVNYDPSITTEKELTAHAAVAKCSLMKESGSFRADKDPQYYLKQTGFRYLALSPNQRTRINSMIGAHQDARKILSPSQLAYLQLIEERKISDPQMLYEDDFQKAWSTMKTTMSEIY